MKPAPSARRQLVGRMLRAYREAQDYKLEEAARVLDCDRSKISRIETGERGIRAKDLRELLTEYGVDEITQNALVAITRPRGATGWWKAYDRILPPGYLDFAATEAAATRIMAYAPTHVPDLLQNPDYAEALAAADPFVPNDAKDRMTEATLAHQVAVLERQNPPDIRFVIGEAALHQQVGSGPWVMRPQLTRLEEVSMGEYAWITLHVLPFTAGSHTAALGGAFTVLQFPTTPAMGFVYLPGPHGGISLTDEAAVATYAKTFEHLSRYALPAEQSTRRLRQLARRDR